MKNNLPKGIPQDIYDVFAVHESGYLTVSYIARICLFSEDVVLEVLKKYPKVFKKSYLLSPKGADVYFLRKNCFWKLKDFWNTVRYINSLKY